MKQQLPPLLAAARVGQIKLISVHLGKQVELRCLSAAFALVLLILAQAGITMGGIVDGGSSTASETRLPPRPTLLTAAQKTAGGAPRQRRQDCASLVQNRLRVSQVRAQQLTGGPRCWLTSLRPPLDNSHEQRCVDGVP